MEKLFTLWAEERWFFDCIHGIILKCGRFYSFILPSFQFMARKEK